MKITLYLRRDRQRPTHFTMRTDTTAERDDSPRIHNLGIEIKEAIDRIIAECEQEGVVSELKHLQGVVEANREVAK